MQTTSFLPKVVCPHALKNSTIPVGLLKTKVIKKIARQDQNPADRGKVLVAVKMEDEAMHQDDPGKSDDTTMMGSDGGTNVVPPDMSASVLVAKTTPLNASGKEESLSKATMY